MYSLFRVMFIMYFGDADGERVQFRPLPIYRKGLLSVLVVVVLAMGIVAPVVLKVTEDATNLNMKEDVFQKNVNTHLKEVNHK